MSGIPEIDPTSPLPFALGSRGSEVDVFSSCPSTAGDVVGTAYLERVRKVATWSENQGCRGTLIYCDKRLADPWLVAQVLIQSTKRLAPLVAVQPAYMHPFAVATMIATLAALHSRRVYVNWVAGGFKTDLQALADDTPHDARYDRLIEYASLVRRLTDGESVTFAGRFYEVRGLTLQPQLDPRLRPEFLLSGSSPAGRAAAEALGARAVSYALPTDEPPAIPPPRLTSGLRLGVIARSDREVAWHAAYTRFPPDRRGVLTRALARKVSDSQWHARLCLLAEERADAGSPYWMTPFESYATTCPYLVGSHEEIAGMLAEYFGQGFQTFILDEPESEADLAHARVAFALAMAKDAPVA